MHPAKNIFFFLLKATCHSVKEAELKVTEPQFMSLSCTCRVWQRHFLTNKTAGQMLLDAG